MWALCLLPIVFIIYVVLFGNDKQKKLNSFKEAEKYSKSDAFSEIRTEKEFFDAFRNELNSYGHITVEDPGKVCDILLDMMKKYDIEIPKWRTENNRGLVLARNGFTTPLRNEMALDMVYACLSGRKRREPDTLECGINWKEYWKKLDINGKGNEYWYRRSQLFFYELYPELKDEIEKILDEIDEEEKMLCDALYKGDDETKKTAKEYLKMEYEKYIEYCKSIAGNDKFFEEYYDPIRHSQFKEREGEVRDSPYSLKEFRCYQKLTPIFFREATLFHLLYTENGHGLFGILYSELKKKKLQERGIYCQAMHFDGEMITNERLKLSCQEYERNKDSLQYPSYDPQYAIDHK